MFLLSWFESSSGSDRLLVPVVRFGDDDNDEDSSFATAAEEEVAFAAAPTANGDDDDEDDFIGDIETLTTMTTTAEGEARCRPSTKTTLTRPPRRRSDDGLNCYPASFDADPETTMPSLAKKITPTSSSSLIPPPDSKNI